LTTPIELLNFEVPLLWRWPRWCGGFWCKIKYCSLCQLPAYI